MSKDDPDYMAAMRTSWRQEISYALQSQKEGWDDVEHCTLSEVELDQEFHSGYGGHNRWGAEDGGGVPFGVWTTRRVYFPVSYDDAVAVAYVPRHPGEAIEHRGEHEVRDAMLRRHELREVLQRRRNEAG